MISKPKLGSIAFIVATAMSLAFPSFAASIYSPSETGGGSWGYNHHMAIDQWRLKHNASRHNSEHHLPSKSQ